jgi:hypothetical protein
MGLVDYNLFNGTISYSNYIASSDWMKACNELERMWKGAVVVQVQVLSRHLSEETEENHGNP